jgi:hypothetical protein
MYRRKEMEELVDMAVDRIVERVLNAEKAWQDSNGLIYGDIPLSTPEDFVMFYIDLRDRGVLDNLRVISPEVSADLDERFEKDSLRVMGVR